VDRLWRGGGQIDEIQARCSSAEAAAAAAKAEVRGLEEASRSQVDTLQKQVDAGQEQLREEQKRAEGLQGQLEKASAMIRSGRRMSDGSASGDTSIQLSDVGFDTAPVGDAAGGSAALAGQQQADLARQLKRERDILAADNKVLEEKTKRVLTQSEHLQRECGGCCMLPSVASPRVSYAGYVTRQALRSSFACSACLILLLLLLPAGWTSCEPSCAKRWSASHVWTSQRTSTRRCNPKQSWLTYSTTPTRFCGKSPKSAPHLFVRRACRSRGCSCVLCSEPASMVTRRFRTISKLEADMATGTARIEVLEREKGKVTADLRAATASLAGTKGEVTQWRTKAQSIMEKYQRVDLDEYAKTQTGETLPCSCHKNYFGLPSLCPHAATFTPGMWQSWRSCAVSRMRRTFCRAS
jgi:hypothetical protein